MQSEHLTDSDNQVTARRTRRGHVLRLCGVVLAMFGFGFALVPLYDVLCEVTGLNGRSPTGFAATDRVREGAPAVDESRLVTVEIITEVQHRAPWSFGVETQRFQMHPGEFVTARVVAQNLRQQDMVVQAVPSVLPWNATQYVHKTACFCFDKQSFGAGEKREMPVVFTIDPELPAEVDTVTMAYTLFELSETARAD